MTEQASLTLAGRDAGGAPLDGQRARVARDLVRFAEGEITAAVGEVWPGRPVRVGRATTGGRTVVCRVSVGGRPAARAAYSLLGTSIAVLARGDHGGLVAVREAQQAYVASGAGVLDREAAQLELLRGHSAVRVRGPIALRGGVLITPWVGGSHLGRQLLARPELTADLLAGVFAELSGLHTGPAQQLRQAARVGTARAVPAVLARAGGGGPDRWREAGMAVGWADPAGVAEVRALGLRLVARLGRLARRLDRATLMGVGVCVGGLAPSQVLYPPGSVRPVFVSPALGPGGQVVDVGVLLGRLHLLLAATRPTAQVTGRLVEGVEAWLCRQAAGRAAAWQGWLGAVLTFWAADVLDTLATRLALPRGVLPFPPGTATVTRWAFTVLTALEAFTATLADHGPDAAMTVALDGLRGTGRAPGDPVRTGGTTGQDVATAATATAGRAVR